MTATQRFDSAGSEPPRLFRLISAMTRLIPNLPHASGLSNRIVKPLWCRMYKGSYRVRVWDGIEMILNPSDSLGGYLAFVPHLYDVWERQAICELLPEGGTFVDVGSNIGAYSLWAAVRVGVQGKVLAYEAEPANFERLRENIALNNLDQVSAYCVGVSDRAEKLKLRLNPVGNAGGHSFIPGIYAEESVAEVEVQCYGLQDLLKKAGVTRVDFMKLDIEGFEHRVLTAFFRDVPQNSALRPSYILTEMYFGNVRGAGTLWDTIVSAGYKLEREGKANSLFKRA